MDINPIPIAGTVGPPLPKVVVLRAISKVKVRNGISVVVRSCLVDVGGTTRAGSSELLIMRPIRGVLC